MTLGSPPIAPSDEGREGGGSATKQFRPPSVLPSSAANFFGPPPPATSSESGMISGEKIVPPPPRQQAFRPTFPQDNRDNIPSSAFSIPIAKPVDSTTFPHGPPSWFDGTVTASSQGMANGSGDFFGSLVQPEGISADRTIEGEEEEVAVNIDDERLSTFSASLSNLDVNLSTTNTATIRTGITESPMDIPTSGGTKECPRCHKSVDLRLAVFCPTCGLQLAQWPSSQHQPPTSIPFHNPNINQMTPQDQRISSLIPPPTPHKPVDLNHEQQQQQSTEDAYRTHHRSEQFPLPTMVNYATPDQGNIVPPSSIKSETDGERRPSWTSQPSITFTESSKIPTHHPINPFAATAATTEERPSFMATLNTTNNWSRPSSIAPGMAIRPVPPRIPLMGMAMAAPTVASASVKTAPLTAPTTTSIPQAIPGAPSIAPPAPSQKMVYPIVSFGVGGRVLISLPIKQVRYMSGPGSVASGGSGSGGGTSSYFRPSSINILPLCLLPGIKEHIIEPALSVFGEQPIDTKWNIKTKDLIAGLEALLARQPPHHRSTASSSRRLLLELLKLMLSNPQGTVDTAAISFLLGGNRTTQGGSPALSDHQPITIPTSTPVVTTGDEIAALVMRGDKAGALVMACSQQLWSHALILASQMDSETFSSTIGEFARQALPIGHLLRTAYHLFASQAAILDPEVIRSTWNRHLALILANRTADDHLAMLGLGDAVSMAGDPAAGHLCYLLSDDANLLGGPQGEYTRIVYLGTDHTVHPASFWRNWSALRLTEILEYALRQANPAFHLLYLATYRLALATWLADWGYLDASLKYLYEVEETISGATGPPAVGLAYINDLVRQTTRNWLDRISRHSGISPANLSISPGGTAANTGGWLPKMGGMLVEAFDRGINRMIGVEDQAGEKATLDAGAKSDVSATIPAEVDVISEVSASAVVPPPNLAPTIPMHATKISEERENYASDKLPISAHPQTWSQGPPPHHNQSWNQTSQWSQASIQTLQPSQSQLWNQAPAQPQSSQPWMHSAIPPTVHHPPTEAHTVVSPEHKCPIQQPQSQKAEIAAGSISPQQQPLPHMMSTTTSHPNAPPPLPKVSPTMESMGVEPMHSPFIQPTIAQSQPQAHQQQGTHATSSAIPMPIPIPMPLQVPHQLAMSPPDQPTNISQPPVFSSPTMQFPQAGSMMPIPITAKSTPSMPIPSTNLAPSASAATMSAVESSHFGEGEDLGFGNRPKSRTEGLTTTTSPTSRDDGESVSPKNESNTPSADGKKGMLGFLTGWFGKKGGSVDAVSSTSGSSTGGPKKANLGEPSSFRYDQKLGRWVDDKDPSTFAPTTPPPPPPVSLNTPSPAPTSTLAPVPAPLPPSLPTAPSAPISGGLARSTSRARYIDPFNPPGSSSSAVNDAVRPPAPSGNFIPMPATVGIVASRPMMPTFSSQTNDPNQKLATIHSTDSSHSHVSPQQQQYQQYQQQQQQQQRNEPSQTQQTAVDQSYDMSMSSQSQNTNPFGNPYYGGNA